MSNDSPKRDTMSIEEATVSNMWEIGAIVEGPNGRAGFCTMDESTARSRHPDSMRRAFPWALLLMLVLLLSAPAIGAAQVVTNITSSGLNTTVTQAGNLYNITGGTRPGSGPNLFHSFGDFSVGAGDIGNFLNNTGLPTSNILGRVTGGNISNIYGTIQTTGFGTANLFLVNPSGIVFGPNGSVNVGGSVSFSTAQYLRLFDGVNSANFYANPANDGLANSVLAVAPVVDFGFLSPAAYGFLTAPDPSATITVQGSALSVPSGQSISLVGGKVVIQAATLPDGTVQPAHLSAPNGTIQLASTASPGEFDVATLQPLPNVDAASLTSFGSVSLAPGSSIDVSGPRTVFVKGGQLVLSVNDATLSTTESSAPSDTVSLSPGSSIMTSNSGTEPGSDVQITVGTLQMGGASIQSTTTGDGSGGNITADVGTLALTNGAMISSNSLFWLGQGGNVTVQGLQGPGSSATSMSLDNSTISTTVSGGNAATTPVAITITAETLDLANLAHIQADTSGAAPAGNITLNVDTLTATNANETGYPIPLTIFSRSLLEDSTAGKAGNITIQGITGPGSPATRVSLDGGTSTPVIFGTCCLFISTQIAGGSKDTPPGSIKITAQTLDLNKHAHIDADTTGAAPAGDITLNVDTLTAGNIAIDVIALTAGIASISSRSSFTDSTAGKAGNITIQGITGSGSPAANVSLDNNSTIRTEILGGSAFNTPGAITITAQTLALANESAIRADTLGGAASPGNITLNVGKLTVGNSVISSRSNFRDVAAAGNAGNITIQGITGSGSPATSVRLDNNSSISNDIFLGSAASKRGTITITAHTLDLKNHAFIGADTYGAAPAGYIALNVDTLTAGNSLIVSRTFVLDQLVAGNAGSITIQGITGSGSPATSVRLDNSVISTEIWEGSAASKPGAITITAHTLALANESTIRADTLGAASAGDITLNVGTLTAGNSMISSSSPFIDSTTGNAGSITIQGINGSGSPAANVSLDSGTLNGPIRGTIITMIVGGTSSTTPATIDITAQTVNLANGAQIKADTIGAAPAGNIALNVGMLTADGSSISSSSGPKFLLGDSAGNAGSITIQGITGSGSPAANVSLDSGTISTTIAGGTLSNVPANITIAAQSVTLSNGVAITASTTGNAPAGNIELVTQQLTMTPDSAITSNAQTGGTGTAGSITITGAGSAPTTIAGGTIQAQSETSASAGDITLHAPGDLTLLGTTVSVKNTGTGDAGSINFHAGNDLLVRNSQVSTESAEASGGNIKLTAPNLVRIVDSTLTSSVKGEAGSNDEAGSNGGNINIDPQWVVIQNSQLLANANAGAGGNITITATGAVLIDPNSLLSASAGPAGVSGSVNINAPIQVLSGALMPLNLAYSQASLSGDRCAADPTGQFSSFVQTGRDGVPQVPGALSPSPLSFLETLTSGSWGSQSPNWAAMRLGLDSVSFDDSTRFHAACRS